MLAALSAMSYAVSFNRIIYPIKTKDASGYILEQDQAPMRIISADPAVTEILFAYNLKDRIVGVSNDCDFPEDAKKIEKVGRDRLDLNKIAKLQPDLVIVSFDKQKNELEKLRNFKYPVTVSGEVQMVTLEVFAVDPKSLSDVVRNFFTIGTITNREHAAYSLVQKFNRQIEWVDARVKNEKHLRALVLVKRGPNTFASQGTFIRDLMVRGGFSDISPRGSDTTVMDRKMIESLDPGLVITSTKVARNPQDIYNNGDFKKTEAGKNKMAVCLDDELFTRAGPRLTQGLEKVAASAYGWSDDGQENK